MRFSRRPPSLSSLLTPTLPPLQTHQADTEGKTAKEKGEGEEEGEENEESGQVRGLFCFNVPVHAPLPPLHYGHDRKWQMEQLESEVIVVEVVQACDGLTYVDLQQLLSCLSSSFHHCPLSIPTWKLVSDVTARLQSHSDKEGDDINVDDWGGGGAVR